MCGAAAILSYTSSNPKGKLCAMLDWTKPCFSHSPASHTFFQHNEFALGANQKDDLATSGDGSICVVFSGKLFQKQDISRTDAQTVLNLYQAHGKNCFEQLDGQFALFVFDKRNNELYAARDKMGLCPLYWYQDNHVAIGATSIKALLATGFISPTPDNASLAAYFSQGYISQDSTGIQNVNQLLPGYYLKASMNQKVHVCSFWSFSSSFSHKERIGTDFSEEIYSEIRQKVDNAVYNTAKLTKNLCQTAPTEIGSFILNQTIPYEKRAAKLHIAYSKEFTGDKNSITAQDFLQSLVPVVWAQESPIANFDSIRQYAIIKRCQEENWAYFLDSGFVEEFDNYSTKASFTTPFYPPSKLTKLLYSLFPLYGCKKLKRSMQPASQVAFLEQRSLMNHAECKKAAPNLYNLFDTSIFIQQFYNLKRIPTVNASLFYLSMKSYVTDYVTASRMRLAQNFDIECFSPFLDTKLLQFFASLHPEIWASPDILTTFPAEWLHKEQATLFAMHLPLQPALPLTWLNTKEITLLFNTLQKGVLVASGYVSAKWLRQLPKQKPADFLQKLYAIAILEIWIRLFIDLPLKDTNATLRFEELF